MDPYEVMRSLLSDRVIAFHPQLSRVLGGVHEALFFQQIAFWSDKGANPDWIYKTTEEMKEETTLNRYQQDKARAQLKKLGVIEEQRRGLPARLYYRVVWAKLFELLGNAVCSPSANLIAEPSTLVRSPSTNQSAHPRPTSKKTSKKNTEKTQESFEIRSSNGLKRPETLEEVEAWEAERKRINRIARAMER